MCRCALGICRPPDLTVEAKVATLMRKLGEVLHRPVRPVDAIPGTIAIQRHEDCSGRSLPLSQPLADCGSYLHVM